MRILGFDPGTARLGFGLVREEEGKFVMEECGIIETEAGTEKALRLGQIQEDLEAVIKDLQPDCVAVEELFFAKNVKTGIAVAEARGVILATSVRAGLEVIELKPVEIKQAVCGNGKAEKEQMQKMVQVLLGLDKIPQPDDAADALAVAMAGFYVRKFTNLL